MSDKTLTANLVAGFVGHRLEKAGYDQWTNNVCLKKFDLLNNYNHGEDKSSHVAETMCVVGDEFHDLYFNSFQDMVGSINIHADDLKDVIYKIFDVTCETGIEWGRITGIFVFSAILAVKAMDCNRTDVVENIISWTSAYLESQRYSNWISQHNGWAGFVVIYDKPDVGYGHQAEHMLTKAYSVSTHVFSGVASFAKLLLHST